MALTRFEKLVAAANLTVATATVVNTLLQIRRDGEDQARYYESRRHARAQAALSEEFIRWQMRPWADRMRSDLGPTVSEAAEVKAPDQ